MKIKDVTLNNRKKVFEVRTASKTFEFPYAKADPQPTSRNRIAEAYVDEELGREAFTYKLADGKEGAVHIDHVLEYSQDPQFMWDLLIYKLTMEARRRFRESTLSKREMIRRLGTSPSQFYRLFDEHRHQKPMSQLFEVFYVLDCDLDIVIRDRKRRLPADRTGHRRSAYALQTRR